MSSHTGTGNHLEELAGSTLDALSIIAAAVNEKQQSSQINSADSLANSQTFTGANAVNRLNQVSQTLSDGYAAISREPAIARLVYEDEQGKQNMLYITRSASVQGAGDLVVASAKAPLGRLASLDVGDSATISLAGEEKELTLIEVAILKPEQDSEGWDAPDTIYKHEELGVQTILSLRLILQGAIVHEDDFDAWMESSLQNSNVQAGIAHEIRTAMGLRDQPILDKFQDEIFRLPLNSQLFISGPPGTGKTTTLIKRLGQKLDKEFLTDAEIQLVDKAPYSVNHQQSWIMFTPTELLKHYVKEAFAREQVPASDDHIRTWEKTRRDLARNVLGLLDSGSTRGKFVLKSDEKYLKPEVERSPEHWFSQFETFHLEQVYTSLSKALEQASSTVDKASENIIEKIASILKINQADRLSAIYTGLQSLEAELKSVVDATSEQVDKLAKAEISGLFKNDKEIFPKLADYLNELEVEDSVEDEEYAVEDDSESEPVPFRSQLSAQDAAKELMKLVKVVGRNSYQSRSVNKSSKAGKVFEFLGDVVPKQDALKAIGRLVVRLTSLRRILNAPNRYVNDIPANYKRYRKAHASYFKTRPKDQMVSSTELDALILLTLKSARELMQLSFVSRHLDQPKYNFLELIRSQFKNQVLVDEATDFSILQLACMQCLTNLSYKSFFACGDFNQRLTEQGVREQRQLEWLPLLADYKKITTVYRQSQRLNELAGLVLSISGGDMDTLGALPDGYNHQGVQPVLAENLKEFDKVAEWLAERIGEINSSVGKMPTIGVLVEAEESVQPLAGELTKHLSRTNLVAEACLGGKTLGENTDVRVFSAEHIKGLEFEAVFFVNIDELEQLQPELFDKYLYVGVTRAATFLGIACANQMPSKLEGLRDSFIDRWNS